MRVLLSSVAVLALSACNGTNLENKGQEIGAQADEAVSNVSNAVDGLGEDLENVADRADTAVGNVANSADRQIDKVGNAADAAGRELDK